MHRADYDRLYRIWKAMRTRCNNPHTKEYHRYGGRGIKVCDEWNDYIVFRDWAYQNGYTEKLTIDRIDNNKNYSPDNCKWSTLVEQQQNRCTCRMITYNGKTQNMTLWAKELGIPSYRIKKRLQLGWSFEDAINKPLRGVI